MRRNGSFRTAVVTALTATVLVAALTATGSAPAGAAASSVAPFRSTDAFVRQQFRDFQGRTSTAGESSIYAAPLADGSKTAAATVDTIAHLGTPAERNGNVTRLYTAYFQRLPDLGGLEYWINKSASGWTLNKISGNFAGSSEFVRKYGSLSNAGFVDRAFQNVFGRAADPGGRTYWINKLNKGMARGAVMVGFSQSSEYQRKQGPTVEMVLAYRGLLRRLPVGTEATTAVARVQADGFAALAGDLLAQSAYAARFPAPGQVASLLVHPGDGKATLEWKAASTNGVPLAGYTLRVLKGGVQQGGDRTLASTATSTVVTGLTNGQTYTFVVIAFNANRDGQSVTSSPVVINLDVVWSGIRGNASHDGVQPNGVIPAQPTKKWETEFDNHIVDVAVGGGRIYAATVQGQDGELAKLYALDPANGSVLWGPKALTSDAGGNVTLAYADGRVFAGTGEGIIEAFAADSGSPSWSVNLDTTLLWVNGITAFGGVLYTFDGDGLIAIDARNGTTKWKAFAGGTFAIPAADATGVYVVQSCNYVFRFSLTGTKLWSKEDEQDNCEDFGSDLAVLGGGRLFETGSGSGTTMRRQTDGAVVGGRLDSGPPAISGNTAVVMDEWTLRFVDWTTGVERAHQTGDGYLTGLPVVNANRAYVSTEDGPIILSYSLTDGSAVWSRNVALDTSLDTVGSVRIGSFALGDGLLLVQATGLDFGDSKQSIIAYG